MKEKTHRIKVRPVQVLRFLSQVLFFIFLPALYVSTLSGIKDIYLGIYHHNFNITTLWPQMIEAIAILPVTMLLGRFFCGWMCAFGAMGDWISMLSHKLFPHRFRVPEKLDRALKYLKYLWLFVLVAVVWSLGSKAFSAANPWDAFGMLLTFGSAPDFAYVATHLLPALFLLLAIIALSFVVDRFFCRYLCPLGAVFAILSKLRIAHIEKPRDGCGKCRLCTRNCPMGIPLYKKDSFRSGECINCFACTAGCPRKNVSFVVSGGDVRPVVAGTMAVAVMAGVYYAGSFAENSFPTVAAVGSAMQQTTGTSSSAAENNTSGGQTAAGTPAESSSSSAASSSASSGYKDGTYQGSGAGFRGSTTTVSITVQGGKITDVSVVSTQDTPRFFERAYPTVSQAIVSDQSPQVDAVSGATYSSNGIMQAVADALSKAAS